MPHDVSALAADLRQRLASRQRFLLGITGPPGSGKSTLAHQLAAACLPGAAVVSMDGFHLPNTRLEELNLRPRKGAPQTFDAAAFIALLTRLRRGEAVDAPIYDRTLHEPRPNAIHIPAASDLPGVIIEGNYLLLDTHPWQQIRPMLDECWYLDTPLDLCFTRLYHRHLAGGCTVRQAHEKIATNDLLNTITVIETLPRADRVL